MMYWWYFLKVCLLYYSGRWYIWKEVPDKYVRLAGTVYYRELRSTDDIDVIEILGEARLEWKRRKRRSLLLSKNSV